MSRCASWLITMRSRLIESFRPASQYHAPDVFFLFQVLAGFLLLKLKSLVFRQLWGRWAPLLHVLMNSEGVL